MNPRAIVLRLMALAQTTVAKLADYCLAARP